MKASFIEVIRGLGYNPIGIPNPKIVPGSIIGRIDRDQVRYLGELTHLVDNRKRLPACTSDNISSAIEHRLSAQTNGRLNLDLIAEFAAAWGVPSGDFRRLYSEQETISIQLVDVKLDVMAHLEILGYLSGARIRDEQLLGQLLAQQDLYLVEEVIKTKSFKLYIDGTSDDQAKLRAKNLLTAEGRLALQDEQNSSMTFQGDEYVSVGFRAFQLACRDGVLDLNTIPASMWEKLIRTILSWVPSKHDDFVSDEGTCAWGESIQNPLEKELVQKSLKCKDGTFQVDDHSPELEKART